MDKKKNDDVDYAAAYRQFMNFSHGLSLKQFCEGKGYDYGKLQRYSRKAFWSKHTKLNESEVEESGFMPLLHNEQEPLETPPESPTQPGENSLSDGQSKDNVNEISFIKVRFSDGLTLSRQCTPYYKLSPRRDVRSMGTGNHEDQLLDA